MIGEAWCHVTVWLHCSGLMGTIAGWTGEALVDDEIVRHRHECGDWVRGLPTDEEVIEARAALARKWERMIDDVSCRH